MFAWQRSDISDIHKTCSKVGLVFLGQFAVIIYAPIPREDRQCFRVFNPHINMQSTFVHPDFHLCYISDVY